MSEFSGSSSSGSSGGCSSSGGAINKRPRLFSFQGLSTRSSDSNHNGNGAPMAGTSSSSLEHIHRREQLASDLRSWQESQIAACIEDNTINIVLEQYINFYEARAQAMQLTRANQQYDVMLEDEAIMMAITERGLQPAAAELEEGDENENVSEGSSNLQNLEHRGAAGTLMETDEGIDLLETAVAAAIQEKGLVATAPLVGPEDSKQIEKGAR